MWKKILKILLYAFGIMGLLLFLFTWWMGDLDITLFGGSIAMLAFGYTFNLPDKEGKHLRNELAKDNISADAVSSISQATGTVINVSSAIDTVDAVNGENRKTEEIINGTYKPDKQ